MTKAAKFKIGDKFYDVSCLELGVATVDEIIDEVYEVTWANKGKGDRYIADEDLIEASVYYSPLYKALL